MILASVGAGCLGGGNSGAPEAPTSPSESTRAAAAAPDEESPKDGWTVISWGDGNVTHLPPLPPPRVIPVSLDGAFGPGGIVCVGRGEARPCARSHANAGEAWVHETGVESGLVAWNLTLTWEPVTPFHDTLAFAILACMGSGCHGNGAAVTPGGTLTGTGDGHAWKPQFRVGPMWTSVDPVYSHVDLLQQSFRVEGNVTVQDYPGPWHDIVYGPFACQDATGGPCRD